MNVTEHKETNYSILADIYDEVMQDVDYETWADYVDEIILEHCPEAGDILELACGTGTVALSLEELDCYNITATDGSPDMIRVAQQKAGVVNSEVDFRTMDFLNITLEKTFDVVYMLFDSLNYLHRENEIRQLHSQVKKILNPGGIFIYDFTTPRNSRKAIRFLNNDSREMGGILRYHRESSFDGKNRVHTNRFRIDRLDPASGTVQGSSEEIHRQKIYQQKEIEALIKQTDFTILQAYDGFELKPAHDKSLRITMVLQ